MSRTFAAQHPEQFGRYLFDCALGEANWTTLQEELKRRNDSFLEIALSHEIGQAALARLPWELIRGPDGYLSNGYTRAGRIIDVAITRRVPGSRTKPRQIAGVPRVLFVVGTSLVDRTVRPAAEIVCVLKRSREGLRRIHARMIENATPTQTGKAVETFHPDVVHLICQIFAILVTSSTD